MDDELIVAPDGAVDSVDDAAASDSSADLIDVTQGYPDVDDDSPDDPDAPDDLADDDESVDATPAPTLPSPEEVERLRARAQELEAQNQEYVTRLREQQVRERQVREQQARGKIKSDYEQAKARILREADDQLNPAQFIAVNMDRLADWRDAQYAAFNEAEKQQLRDAWARAEKPNFAKVVATEYQLSADELDELNEYEPHQMVQEAKRIIKRRSKVDTLARELDQLKREIAAGRAAPAAVTPGAGRGRSRKVTPGSQDHLAAIFAQHQ